MFFSDKHMSPYRRFSQTCIHLHGDLFYNHLLSPLPISIISSISLSAHTHHPDYLFKAAARQTNQVARSITASRTSSQPPSAAQTSRVRSTHLPIYTHAHQIISDFLPFISCLARNQLNFQSVKPRDDEFA